MMGVFFLCRLLSVSLLSIVLSIFFLISSFILLGCPLPPLFLRVPPGALGVLFRMHKAKKVKDLIGSLEGAYRFFCCHLMREISTQMNLCGTK